ncbi:ribonuclease VapC [Neorhizobium galegae]|uniref:type II toxin-antitoxin system VapC family toxin n=1 Tax=Neorhizobium galegae TaxID=399 RepID=UPI001AE665BE|nr:ribonuclease VapC [Neorhizobium galegae]
MYFIDASVIIAILKPERDAEDWMLTLEQAGGPFHISPVVRMEASLSLARAKADALPLKNRRMPDILSAAGRAVDQFMEALAVEDMPITSEIGLAARNAALRYGKTVGHAARLNMGDCFAYACCKSAGLTLLYKGEDFRQTDLA